MEKKTPTLLHNVNKEAMPLLQDPVEVLPFFVKASYGVGHVFNDVCAALWFSYTLLFLQVVLGMPPVLAGTMLLIGQVVDALATPVVGVLADRIGRRKSWHLAGTGLVLVSFPMIFCPCPGCSADRPWLMALYYAGMIIVFQIGWAIVQISHLSLIPDLTGSQKGRAELTAIRYTASVCSSVAVYIITWAVLHVTRNTTLDAIGPGDAFKFRNIALISTGVGIITSIWFHCGLKSNMEGRQQNTHSINIDDKKISTIASLMRTPLLLQVSLLYVASRLFLTISLVYMPLYLNESLGEGSEVLALVPLVSYIASFVASLGIKYVNNSWGSKLSYLIGASISIGGCIWIRYGAGWEFLTSYVYGAAVFLGSGSSITMVTSLCITAEFIGSHTENGAFVYSVVTFADKLFNGIAVMVIEDLKCPSKKLCPHYYRDVLAYVCGGSAILGIIVLATMSAVPIRNRLLEGQRTANGEVKHFEADSPETEPSIYH
ncbi:major facilitator superfamily domain-containing protein 12 [Anabrus simplex]|uniref:major facilitator superfamily domain-containing protein 12 n=1 Tax=Anabrus simplex TaxID=316456 RepID=UPI0035A398AB